MINVKTKHGKASIPGNYKELPFGQYIKVKGCRNDLDIIALFLGIAPEELKKYETIENFYLVYNHISFLQKQVEAKAVPDANIKFNGSYLSLPLDLLEIPTGLYLDMLEIAKKGEAITDEDIAELTAMYLSVAVYKEYDYEKAKELIPKVYELDTQTVTDLCSFFLRISSGSSSGTGRIYIRLNILTRRVWRALASLKNTVYSLYCRAYAAVLTFLGKNS